MKKDYVILIPAHFNNAKAIAEEFMGFKEASVANITKAITDKLTNDDEEDEEVLVYSLTAFVQACNDQVINLEGYFITNVFTIS